MFRLNHATPIEWVRRVEAEPLKLLADHAHCEMKAAASAQALIGKNSGRVALVEALCELARDELDHFARVVKLLDARGGVLGPIERNPYAEALLQRSQATRRVNEETLLDRLLVSSLIEARSLERFHLLATHLVDRDLAAFYASLIPSEAAHQGLFRALANDHYPAERVTARLAELTAIEADVVAHLPFAVRMHSGMGEAA